MYDMDKINALLGLPGNDFRDDEYPDEPVNIATEIPATTTKYGHTGNTWYKLEEAKRLGRQYLTTVQANREAMLAMRNTGVKTEDLQKFFHDVYSKHFGPVNFNAKTEAEERAAERAKAGYAQFVKRFENEKRIAGSTVWNMENAYTGVLQHDPGVGKIPQLTAQRRYESSLFGVTASRSVEAFRIALSLTS